MIVKCDKCGKLYERFNDGGYQNEEPHDCSRPLRPLLFNVGWN